jgi:hypothetical protein
MAATIGISSLASLVTAPTGCVVNEVTQEQSKEVKTIKNASGITVQAGLMPMTETKITVKGKGIAALSTVAATASVTSGTVVATDVSVDESNEDYPEFSISAMKWN